MEERIKQYLKVIKLNENTLSMIFGILTVFLVATLVFRVFNSSPTPEITEESEQVSSENTVMLGEVKLETKDDGEKYPADLPEKYTVAKGDHLWMISEKFYGSGYNWVDIAAENGLTNAGIISEGQELVLPKVAVKLTESQKQALLAENKGEDSQTIEGDSYVVAAGDNLWSISVRAYADGYRFGEIAEANGITNPNLIEVGQELKLPR